VTAWGVADATVAYGDHIALDSVSVGFRSGEITAVVGGDGAGKTTLGKLIVGLVRARSGSVDVPAKIGYQSETSGVWGDLTVMENLEFVAVANRLPSAERVRRIDEILEVTQLGDARRRLGAELSGGMRQKLGVAAAVLPWPDLLVLDEPTTGLDPVSRSDLWRLISGFVGDGMAVVFTTTYLDEAETAGRAVALEGGKMLASGAVDDIVGSIRGVIGAVSGEERSANTWRRGDEWRAWFPDGVLPDGVARVTPDLTDVITVSAMIEAGAS